MVLHLDADAFFASVEQALHPHLRGKPVAVINAHLGDRAIVLTASYEARPFGVKTGVLYREAKRLCPQAVFVPLSMRMYGMYSLRIAQLLRTYSPSVEEASIDEWYADLSGLRQVHRTTYEGIARRIQEDISAQLGISVSCGIAHTKILSKMAAGFRKPRGLTVVRSAEREAFLASCAVGDVPGFGPSRAALLTQLGCRTALDAVRLGEERMGRLLGKRGLELHRELSGIAVSPICTTPARRQSLSHHRTFLRPAASRSMLVAEVELLLLESAAKLRRLRLAASDLWLVLREPRSPHRGARTRLALPTSNETVLLRAALVLLGGLAQDGRRYSAAGIGFGGLVPEQPTQLSLFDARENKTLLLSPAVDALNAQYGKGTVTRAAVLPADPKGQAFVGKRQGRGMGLPEITGASAPPQRKDPHRRAGPLRGSARPPPR